MPDGEGLPERPRQRAVAQAIGIGFAITAGLILPIVGGLALDRWLGRAPVFTLIGVLLGLVLAGYELVKLSRAATGMPTPRLNIDPAERERRRAQWDADHPERGGGAREDEE